jgi:hypothetical protein
VQLNEPIQSRPLRWSPFEIKVRGDEKPPLTPSLKDSIMKTYVMMLSGIALLAQTAGLWAGEDETRTLPRVDAIYNEIMTTLTPEVKARIDSTISSGELNAKAKAGIDSTKSAKDSRNSVSSQKNKHLDELPDDIRKQVEKTMQEMEKRQLERKLEFKEMKRGQ